MKKVKLSPEIVDRAKKIEIKTRRLVSDIFVGAYKSAFKGTGLSFTDFRIYSPGDDIRNIAWKLTAKDPQNTKVEDISDTGTNVDGSQIANPESVEAPNPLHKNSNDRFNPTEDPTTYFIKQKPDVEIIKSINRLEDKNSDGVIWEGDYVYFDFEVTNTGNVPLKDLTVSDENVGSVTCPKTKLAVGESMVCSKRYTIKKDDVNKEKPGVIGSATVTGKPPKGDNATDKSDTGTDVYKKSVNDPGKDDTSNPLGAKGKILDNPTALVLIKANDDQKAKTVTKYQKTEIPIIDNDKFVGNIKLEILEQPKYGKLVIENNNTPNPKVYYIADPDANNEKDSFKYRISDNYGNSDTATAGVELKCSSTQRKDGGDSLGFIGIMAMVLSLLLIANRKKLKGEF